jgi:hypothetical protein
VLAERAGFEPAIPLRVCRISSAVHSTTLPPLRANETGHFFHFVLMGILSSDEWVTNEPSKPLENALTGPSQITDAPKGCALA